MIKKEKISKFFCVVNVFPVLTVKNCQYAEHFCSTIFRGTYQTSSRTESTISSATKTSTQRAELKSLKLDLMKKKSIFALNLES